MHNTQNASKQLPRYCLEGFILALIFMGMAVQILLSKDHLLFKILRAVYTPALVFFAGLSTYDSRKTPAFLLKKAGIYTVLFLFFGLCNQVLLNHKSPILSFARLISCYEVPTPSEIFFSSAILFFVCATIARYTDRILKNKPFFLIVSVLTLFLIFFPEHIFGYSIIGVFTGCNSYNFVPLLPHFGFFFAGMCAAESPEGFSKKCFFISTALTLCSVMLFKTVLNPIAWVLISALPVYIIHILAQSCSFCHRIITFGSRLITCMINKVKKWYQDFFGYGKVSLLSYYIVYTIVFLILAFFVFYPFIENKISIVWDKDGLAQYIPRAYYFINYIHDALTKILHGDFNLPMYDFSIGMGDAVSLSLDPIYWLLAFFNASHVEWAYSFVFILRLYMSGISISILLLYFKKNHYETLFGSLMYTFCGFALYAGVQHAQFLSPMIFLPLLIIATEELYRKNRWYLCTIFVALSLLSSYYFLYMSSLAMGIYYLARFIFTNNKERKNIKYFMSSVFTFAFSYLLGVMIGIFKLFTSFSSYLNSDRSGKISIATPSLFYYSKTWIIKCFVSFITSTTNSPGQWLRLGFIPLAYIAVIILFLKKEKKILKTLFLLCTSFCLFPIAAFVFSGFSSITNRWCYIFALLVTVITVQSIPQLHRLSKRELKILLLGIIPYIIIIIFDDKYRNTANLTALIMLLINYVFIVFMNQKIHLIALKKARVVLLFLCCISLSFNGLFQYTESDRTSSKSFAQRGAVLNQLTNTPFVAFKQFPKDEFYRVSTSTISMKDTSASLIMGYNSLATQNSSINSSIIDYNATMGNTTWSLTRLSGFNNRTFLNALACVKYYSVAETDVKNAFIPYGFKKIKEETINNKVYYIYENQYALPFGYTYSNTITEDELKHYNTIDRQEALLQAASVEEKDFSSDHAFSNINTFSEEVTITNFITDGVELSKDTIAITKPNATLTLQFNGLPDSETYIFFSGQLISSNDVEGKKISMNITCNERRKEYNFYSLIHPYYTGQDNYLFNLGYQSNATNSATITFKDTGTFSYDSLKIYCQPMESYSTYIDNLTEDVLENIEFSDNLITGDISLKKEKLLVLSMPYQKGWTAYVDGQKTELIKANQMYTGLYLDAGTHNIVLKYELPGWKKAVVISFSGIVIFFIALIIRRKRIKINR